MSDDPQTPRVTLETFVYVLEALIMDLEKQARFARVLDVLSDSFEDQGALSEAGAARILRDALLLRDVE